jgi:ferrochelatase
LKAKQAADDTKKPVKMQTNISESVCHQSASNFGKNMKQKPTQGILISNLGTPDAPTAPALRRYLKQFLSDPRIDTGLPAWLWWLILHGIILRVRPPQSARLYQKIWTAQGSPLLAISQQQVIALQQHLQHLLPQTPLCIELGMRYGQPSIAAALARLQQNNVNKIIVLPLYPQYASATTASTFDAISAYFRNQRFIPALQFISDYHQHPLYIQALADSVREHWQEHGQSDLLLLSFHGIPQCIADDGDPYPQQCQTTAQLLAQALNLAPEHWRLCYQSRFGKEPWLQPYTDETLQALASQHRRVDVICAGFAADCLETLEEIQGEKRALFLRAGGQDFHYIPALNACQSHVHALSQILVDALSPV